MNMDDWWMYVVYTADHHLYCGITKDVQNRVRTHNAGRGAKYLRGGRLPVQLCHAWCFPGPDAMSQALEAEAWFKKLSRRKKNTYISTGGRIPRRFDYAFAITERFVSANPQLFKE
jgi:putative endonuclease